MPSRGMWSDSQKTAGKSTGRAAVTGTGGTGGGVSGPGPDGGGSSQPRSYAFTDLTDRPASVAEGWLHNNGSGALVWSKPTHNELGSIQGGGSTERYHLTSAQHTVATQAATGSLNGYLSSADWTTFTGKMSPGQIHAATSKTPPVDADEFALLDSASSFALNRLTYANLKTAVRDYMRTVPMGEQVTVTANNHLMGRDALTTRYWKVTPPTPTDDYVWKITLPDISNGPTQWAHRELTILNAGMTGDGGVTGLHLTIDSFNRILLPLYPLYTRKIVLGPGQVITFYPTLIPNVTNVPGGKWCFMVTLATVQLAAT